MATSHRRKTGIYLGIPYDWRRPTAARAKSRWWNPRDRRLFTPKTFGWGWEINFARLLGRKPKSSKKWFTPGWVYVEEVPSGPRPIDTVGTSTAGFVGSDPEKP